MRKTIIAFFFLLAFSLSLKTAYAQLPPIVDTIETIIGTVTSGGGSGGTEISSWAKQISSGLERARGCSGTIYNRQQKRYTNGSYTAKIRDGTCSGYGYQTYFCSNLVIDSYNLAGFKNNFSTYVYTMARDWQKKGWTVLKGDNRENLSRLRPGDAIFMGQGANGMDVSYATSHHTVIITSNDINSNGNGKLVLAQSNGGSKYPDVYPYYVRNWQITVCYRNDCPTEWWFGLYP